MTSAEAEFGAALAEFKQHPVPVVSRGEPRGYGDACDLRAETPPEVAKRLGKPRIVNSIAANVSEATLRETFLLLRRARSYERAES